MVLEAEKVLPPLSSHNKFSKKGCIIMRISDDIKYVGVNDHDIDLFEGQYMVENGMQLLRDSG